MILGNVNLSTEGLDVTSTLRASMSNIEVIFLLSNQKIAYIFESIILCPCTNFQVEQEIGIEKH